MDVSGAATATHAKTIGASGTVHAPPGAVSRPVALASWPKPCHQDGINSVSLAVGISFAGVVAVASATSSQRRWRPIKATRIPRRQVQSPDGHRSVRFYEDQLVRETLEYCAEEPLEHRDLRSDFQQVLSQIDFTQCVNEDELKTSLRPALARLERKQTQEKHKQAENWKLPVVQTGTDNDVPELEWQQHRTKSEERQDVAQPGPQQQLQQHPKPEILQHDQPIDGEDSQAAGGPHQPSNSSSHSSSHPSSRDSTMGVTVVDTQAEANRVVKLLMSLNEETRFHAIDTETREWEPGQSPYTSGRVICFSIYCGDDVDFGSGPRLWVDNMDVDGNMQDMVQAFRPYLEDPGTKKVFHNYSFDHAMFVNEGIHIKGFAGDTMQMARLQHTDQQSYSLSALGGELLGSDWAKQSLSGLMKENKKKLPVDLHLSTSPGIREDWIEYSTFDTVATWKLHQKLLEELAAQLWQTHHGKNCGTMLDFYNYTWRPLAEVLVSMEERGLPIDVDMLQSQEQQALCDYEQENKLFRKWLADEFCSRYPEDGALLESVSNFNPSSSKQMSSLLFGEGIQKVGEQLIGGLGLPRNCVSRRSPSGGVSLDAKSLLELVGTAPHEGVEGCGTAFDYVGQKGCEGLGHRCEMSKIQKSLSTFLKPLQQHADDEGRVHSSLNLFTDTGRLSSSNPNLQQLPALDKDIYNVRAAVACKHGRRLVVADYSQLDLRVLAHLAKCSKMIDQLCNGSDFHSGTALGMCDHVKAAVDRGEAILDVADHNKDHPPLVKELFPTERRQAKAVNFGIAYGTTAFGLSSTLSITKDTAEDMINRWHKTYPEVKQWHERLLKHALSQPEHFVVTLAGRRRYLANLKFFAGELMADRAQPRKGRGNCGWAQRRGFTQSFEERKMGGSAQRKAINAPVQGGAADVVIEAMLKAYHDERLKELGYTLVMQIHDELIFEGPEETAAQALELVRDIMEHPFRDGSQLAVPLPVDAAIMSNWADAKGGPVASPGISP